MESEPIIYLTDSGSWLGGKKYLKIISSGVIIYYQPKQFTIFNVAQKTSAAPKIGLYNSYQGLQPSISHMFQVGLHPKFKILNPKSWRLGLDDFPFPKGWFSSEPAVRVLGTTKFASSLILLNCVPLNDPSGVYEKGSEHPTDWSVVGEAFVRQLWATKNDTKSKQPENKRDLDIVI